MRHSISGWIGFEIPGDSCEPVHVALEEAIASLGGTTTGRSLKRDDYAEEIEQRIQGERAYWDRVHEVEKELVKKHGHTEASISHEANEIVNDEWGHNPLTNLLAPDFSHH